MVEGKIRVINSDNKNKPFYVRPAFVVRDSSTVVPHYTFSPDMNGKVRIASISTEPNTVVLGLRQRDFVVMQAVMFPAMNLLWTGCVIMVLGGTISVAGYASKARKPAISHLKTSPAPEISSPQQG